MVDFEILEDIPHYGQNDENLERRYTCPALGLFYVRRNGDIIPIAIQFHQVPSEANPIWTANDSELDWIYAKMWLRNADTQWHRVSFRTERSFSVRSNGPFHPQQGLVDWVLIRLYKIYSKFSLQNMARMECR